MTLTVRRCPECGGQVVSAGVTWHRSDCPHLDNLWPPVEEVEVVPVERCVTADCGRVAARIVFIEEAEPPGWYSYCEQCAAELNGEAVPCSSELLAFVRDFANWRLAGGDLNALASRARELLDRFGGR